MADIFGDDFDDKGRSRKSSDFAELFEESASTSIEKELSVGDKIQAEILAIGKDEAFVSTGTMKDGVIIKSELLDKERNFPHKVGDRLELYVVQVKNTQVILSPKPTSKNLADDLEDAFDMMLPIEGRVTETVKGGFRVAMKGHTAFCPISQIDLKFVEDAESYVGKKFEFVITQFERKNIVVSRRKLLDEQKALSLESFREDHKPGDLVSGAVTRLEKFGAFIEIAPGLEGLAHISELSWARIEDPTEIVQMGQEVQAKILKIEEVKGRLNVSLSLKQATPEPWENLPDYIQEGKMVQGTVTRCMKFGAFVELIPGVEGLIPMSEMSYTQRVMRSDELIKEGEPVHILIKEINREDKKLLLSLKDAGGDPWALVPQKFPEGSVVAGTVERREPYGLFVQIEEGVTGLLPKSKAQESPEFPFEKLKLGEKITVRISEIKMAERRISLDVPDDADSEAWQDFKQKSAASAGMGTFGDQFKDLFKGKA